MVIFAKEPRRTAMVRTVVNTTELQRLRNQIKNICPSKKDMRQFGGVQQHSVMTGSQILSGMKEHDDRNNATKAKKTNSGAAPPIYPVDRPSALTKRKTPSIPVTPEQSSLRVCFRRIPIDLTRATGSGAQKDSENESFLSILGSSDDNEYRLLHVNRTPRQWAAR